MKHTRSILVLGALAGCVLVGAVLAPRLLAMRGTSWWTDHRQIRADAANAPIRSILWENASPIPGGVNSSVDEYEPRLSADGTLMVFVRRRPGSNADLVSSYRTPTGWTEPAPVEGVNTPSDELGPELSSDGTRLYFYSDRAGGSGGYDLWVATRIVADASPNGAWELPTNLGPPINSPANEYGPALTPDGATLYFSSNRPREGEPAIAPHDWSATIREQRDRHDYDIYRAPISPSAIKNVIAITEWNTARDEGSPAVSPAGDFVYFASDRQGGRGGFDLYRARVDPSGLGEPQGLGDAINSPANDLDPGLSSDGFRLHFSSDRPANDATASDAPPDYGLWFAPSREVVRIREPAPLDLTPLWESLWPWLLLLASMLLVLLLLARLLRNPSLHDRLGKLSLLARCLLISLVVHAVIASLLAGWKVGSGIVNMVKRQGGTRVVITSNAASAGGIVSQIRGVASGATTLIPLAASSPPVIHARVSDAPSAPMEAHQAPRPSEPTFSPALSPADAVLASPTPSTPTITRDEAPNADATVPSAPSPATPMPEVSRARDLAPASRGALRLPDAAPTPRIALAPGAGPARPDVPVFDLGNAPASPSTSVSSPAPSASHALPSRDDATHSPGNDAPLPSAAPRTPPPVEPSRPLGGEILSSHAPASVTRGSPEAPSVRADVPPSAPEREGDGVRVVGPAAQPADRGASLSAIPGSTARLPEAPHGNAPIPAPVAPGAREPSPSAPGSSRVPLATAAPAAPGLGRSPAREMPAPFRVDPSPRNEAPTGAPVVPSVLAGEASTPGSGSSIPGAGPLAPAREDVLASGIRLPETLPEPVETFAQRAPEMRAEVLEKMGGSAETERAVTLALEWFTRHQEPDGRWTGRHFDDRCGKCESHAEFDADAAMTGLTLLCYLGAGHTHVKDGAFQEHVRKALSYLVARQAPNGDLRQKETMYGQTVATVALCEAYAMTKDQALAGPARRAVEFVLTSAARSASPRSSPSEQDTPVLGWLVMTVESARRAGFDVPRGTFDGATRWLDTVSTRRNRGRYSYRPGEQPSTTMTAEAMFVQQILGHPRTETRMEQSASFIAQSLPAWEPGAPTHHWYYATLALFEHQGADWQTWNNALTTALLANQIQDGPAAGSWAPMDQWSRMGGRVYQTAICTLSLEVYYRYKPR